MKKGFKFYFSRLIAFVSPFLWRKIFCKPSHWDDPLAQCRLALYVRDGVSVRLPRKYLVSEADLERANKICEFAETIRDHHRILDEAAKFFVRPCAEDENP